MSEQSNQFPKIPPISTTETYLLECSRSNSLIDKSKYRLQGGEDNAQWINSTDNFVIKRGDQISIEMVALNLAQTTTPMEFTGENVVLEGAETKEYVDNKVLLEIGYYINNNQSYTNNLPFALKNGINDKIDPDATSFPPQPFGINRQNIVPMADSTAITSADVGTYPGYGMGFGYKHNDVVAGLEDFNIFQEPNINAASFLNSYRIVGFTEEDYITPLPNPLPAGTNAYSVILERDQVGAVAAIPPATPSSFTSYKSFLHWEKIGNNEGMFGSVGMKMNFCLDDGSVENSAWEVVDIVANQAINELSDSTETLDSEDWPVDAGNVDPASPTLMTNAFNFTAGFPGTGTYPAPITFTDGYIKFFDSGGAGGNYSNNEIKAVTYDAGVDGSGNPHRMWIRINSLSFEWSAGAMYDRMGITASDNLNDLNDYAKVLNNTVAPVLSNFCYVSANNTNETAWTNSFTASGGGYGSGSGGYILPNSHTVDAKGNSNVIANTWLEIKARYIRFYFGSDGSVIFPGWDIDIARGIYSPTFITTPGSYLADTLRVQILFPQDNPAYPNSGGISGFSADCSAGRACCFQTPNMRYSDIFRMQGLPSWNNTGTGGNPVFTQNRQNSGISDFFTNGIQGSYTPPATTGTIVNPMPINLAFPSTGLANIATGLGNMTFTGSNGGNVINQGGIGSTNRLQGTDNLPYIITRNDYMGGHAKANCEDLGRYNTWTPDLKPLTSFIELEAQDLLMDATALANKINEKLHQSLPGIGENSDDINNYQTNVYGFTKRYKKSSQLLPFNQYEGYWPDHAYPQTSGVAGEGFLSLSYTNTEIWNSIDTYFSGGCKQIIPANFQPGFNKIDFIGYNSTLYMRVDVYSQNRLYGQTYPSFESTYLRTCKLPPDWYGDACSWNNTIDGNKGVKDIFKHMWGDSFNRIPIWDGNSRSPTGTYRGANSRNFNMPVILNTQLQNYSVGNQLVNPDTYYDLAEFDTTLLIKNQLIFTNIYYNVESMNATEKVVGNRTTAIGEEYFEKLRQALVEKQRDYEIYINTDNKTADSYDKQLQDYNGWAIELDLGMTDDYLTTKWADGYSDNQDSVPIKVNWIENNLNPPASSAGTYPSYVSLGYGLCPTQTSCWFGSGKIIPQATPPFANGDERFDWNRNQSVNRPVGRIWIQSKYDPNWLDTSNTGGEIAPYPNSNYPQLPQSAELNDTKCEWLKPGFFNDARKFADDTWSKQNDMGIYPYQYTDVDGGTHIFCAFRVATDYKATNSALINSQITNTWRIGQLQWGLRFGFSPSAFDNYQVTPMNPDKKPHKQELAEITVAGVPSAAIEANEGLIQNCNSYIAVGADNPTFAYDPSKSRMELSKMYKSTQLSPYNSSGPVNGTTPPPDLPELGQKVALFNDKCPDALYSPPQFVSPPPPPPVAPLCYPITGGGSEKTQNQRSEETGIFIYKVWLPNENWNAPTDINLYSYWNNNSPDTQKFANAPTAPLFDVTPNYKLGEYIGGSTGFAPPYQVRNNQDGTEQNREAILENCVEASDENWRGSLLSKLGFTKEQFLPNQGRQYNRYSINGYNNPQPDLLVTQNTKPFILNNQSNITLDPAFNINYIFQPSAGQISGLPNYGLGFMNNQPIVTASTDASLTAINPIESTNSPFFQIYSTICPNNYLDNGTKKGIMFYCMKNYQSGNYSYGYGSTFAHTATKDYNLDQIQTEIRNPITGRLMRVLQPNSVITYKITRPIMIAPPVYDEDGNPIDPTQTDPLAEDITESYEQLMNLVPPQQGTADGIAGGQNAPVPPEAQGNTFFFNNNNQVVNLNTDEKVAEDAKALQQEFVQNPAYGGFRQNPLGEVVGEQGIIEAKIRDLEGDETKEGKADTPGAPPQGLGSRADLSSRELLYDYLVHITLNELIPVDAEMFRNSKKLSETLGRAYKQLVAFAQQNGIEELARKMEDGTISKEQGLIDLGNKLFDKESGANKFFLNSQGRRLKEQGESDPRFFYEISPDGARQLAEILSRQGSGGGQGGGDDSSVQFSEIADTIKSMIENTEIVLNENVRSGDDIQVIKYVNKRGDVSKVDDMDFKFPDLPKQYARNNGKKTTESTNLPKGFDPQEYLKAEARGLGQEYLDSKSGSAQPEDVSMVKASQRIDEEMETKGGEGGGAGGGGDSVRRVRTDKSFTTQTRGSTTGGRIERVASPTRERLERREMAQEDTRNPRAQPQTRRRPEQGQDKK